MTNWCRTHETRLLHDLVEQHIKISVREHIYYGRTSARPAVHFGGTCILAVSRPIWTVSDVLVDCLQNWEAGE